MIVRCGPTRAERAEALKQWHPWFAWFPVRTEDGCRWLETVERRGSRERYFDGIDTAEQWAWEYRAVGGEADDAPNLSGVRTELGRP
jgi:hypothetical protein